MSAATDVWSMPGPGAHPSGAGWSTFQLWLSEMHTKAKTNYPLIFRRSCPVQNGLVIDNFHFSSIATTLAYRSPAAICYAIALVITQVESISTLPKPV